jgi:hypothetical protein
VALRPLALEVSDAHLAQHPEDVERYGADLAHQWCTHDFQHVLAWAVGDLDLDGQVGWLARVLSSRGYPVGNLISCLHTAAGIVRERLPEPDGSIVAGRLEGAAARAAKPRQPVE